MTILRILQDYLSEYPRMAMQPLSDITEENSSCYALAPTGNGKTSKDVIGNRTYQNSYSFYAKESASNEIDRQENHDFLEEFSNWLEERNDNQDLPTLTSGYEAQEIQVSNAMLFDLYEDGTGLYQIQIQLIFKKIRSDF